MATDRAKAYGSQLDIPGPGSYEHATDQRASGFLGDAPCYSMGARKAVPKPDDASPGPVYSPRILTPASRGPVGDAAQYSFGSSKRFEPGTSKEPGPGQYSQTSTRVGGTLIGDAAKYGFGTSSQRPAGDLSRGQRFISKEHAGKANYAVHSPGPLVYELKDNFGTVLSGTGAPNSARYTMRPRLEGYQPAGPGVDQPGPGKYNSSMAFGQQVQSARNSAASYGFGTSERHRPELHPKKTAYIGKDYERQNWGIHSPGPSKYDTKHSIGPTVAPQYKASPSFSFGGENRFAY